MELGGAISRRSAWSRLTRFGNFAGSKDSVPPACIATYSDQIDPVPSLNYGMQNSSAFTRASTHISRVPTLTVRARLQMLCHILERRSAGSLGKGGM